MLVIRNQQMAAFIHIYLASCSLLQGIPITTSIPISNSPEHATSNEGFIEPSGLEVAADLTVFDHDGGSQNLTETYGQHTEETQLEKTMVAKQPEEEHWMDPNRTYEDAGEVVPVVIPVKRARSTGLWTVRSHRPDLFNSRNSIHSPCAALTKIEATSVEQLMNAIQNKDGAVHVVCSENPDEGDDVTLPGDVAEIVLREKIELLKYTTSVLNTRRELNKCSAEQTLILKCRIFHLLDIIVTETEFSAHTRPPNKALLIFDREASRKLHFTCASRTSSPLSSREWRLKYWLWLTPEGCCSASACFFQFLVFLCLAVLAVLLVRWIMLNGWTLLSSCSKCLRFSCSSKTMQGIHCIYIGMDEKSWARKSLWSEQVVGQIYASLASLFNRCQMTLLPVGSLSCRLGKSLNARPESQDSLQEYRLTNSELGADADFMLVLQVSVSSPQENGNGLSGWQLMERRFPYQSMPARLPSSTRQSLCESDTSQSLGALNFSAVTDLSPSPDHSADDSRILSIAYTAAGSPVVCYDQETDCVQVDGLQMGYPMVMRSSSYDVQRHPEFQRETTLQETREVETPPGYAKLKLCPENIPESDRSWWMENMSEADQDGVFYLSSMKARQLMESMFQSIELEVTQDLSSMSMVDNCLADYRGEPSYTKTVRCRGPAVSLQLTQNDDQSICCLDRIARHGVFYMLCLLIGAIMLIPFSLWICLTGGSWPVRKCMGGVCCSIYYFATILLPMMIVIPVIFVMHSAPHDHNVDDHGHDHDHSVGHHGHNHVHNVGDHDMSKIALVVYVGLSAVFGAIFVCVSRGFFKLPTIFYGDFTTAVVCPSWPNEASQFKTRQRLWPRQEVVSTVVQQSCHLVPKTPLICRCSGEGHTDPCSEAHILWRYSFSQAEVTLCREIPEHYRRAYVAFKWLIKKYIIKPDHNSDCTTSNMRSYYLKTVLLWELEECGVADDEAGVEEDLLHRLTSRLQHHVAHRSLPHFFLPEVNVLAELSQLECEQLDSFLSKVLVDAGGLFHSIRLGASMVAIGLCETLFCTPGKDYRSGVCCNYASRLHDVW